MAFGKKAHPAPNMDGSSPKTQKFDAPPDFMIDPELTYVAKFVTNHGEFTVELDAKRAPVTVNNFVFLALYHYYDGLAFHRIIPGFVIQGGDPVGNGTGGPGYRFRDELPKQGEYRSGSLAMANAGPNTNGSQFFIITGPAGVGLNPAYALFGQVIEGMETVMAIESMGSQSGAPTSPCIMESVTISVL